MTSTLLFTLCLFQVSSGTSVKGDSPSVQAIRKWVKESENQIKALPDPTYGRALVAHWLRVLVSRAKKEDAPALGLLEIGQVRRIVNANPGSVKYRINLGDAMTRQGRRDPEKARHWFLSALAEYEEAARLSPRSRPIIICLAGRYMELKGVEPSFPAKKLHVQKALENANRAVNLAPESAGSHSIRAMVRLDPFVGDLPGARADIEKALKLDPDHLHGFYCRARIHFMEKQFDKARKDLDRSGYSRKIEGRLLKAKILYVQKKLARALEEMDVVLEENPSHLEALMIRSLVRIGLGERNPARRDLLAAREIAKKQGRTDVLRVIDTWMKTLDRSS